jgi:SAM-dependent methyltransferase
MDLATFHRLVTPDGRSALAAAAALAPTESTVLTCLDRLRKSFDPDLARAAVETVLLRERARDKFARAGEMFFTREALEQASGEVVSAHRAKRFQPFDPVADLGCGIGGDAIALAGAGWKVIAFDTDPVRAAMAAENLRVYGLTAEVRVADVLTVNPSEFAAAFCDPSRRADGRRFLSVAEYLPNPHEVVAHFPGGFPFGFKLAPGVPIDDAVGLGGEVEFLSVDGELKECVVWLGPLDTAARRATVLPSGETLFVGEHPPTVEVTPIGAYLFDPDPAVVRAGLDNLLAAKLAATRFDPGVAGLTGDKPVSSPFVTAYRVEVVLEFHPKKIGTWLKKRSVGRVTPVKRGADVDTDAVVRGWKLVGDDHRFVIFTRAAGKAVAVVAERVGE